MQKFVWVATTRTIGTEEAAYPVALGRTREEAADGWLDYQLADNAATFEGDDESHDQANEDANTAHTALYAGSDHYYDAETEIEVLLAEVEAPEWMEIRP